MKRGETIHARIDRLVDETWGRILARQEATYREHNRSTPIFEERPVSEIEPGTWIYLSGGPVPLGVLSRCKTMIRASGAAYYLPAQLFVRTGIKTEDACDCEVCAAVRERKETAVAA